MSVPKLPAVRVTTEGEYIVQDPLPLDLSANNKFSVSYPLPQNPRFPQSNSASSPQNHLGHASSDNAPVHPDIQSETTQKRFVSEIPSNTIPSSTGPMTSPIPQTYDKPIPQNISRTLSMPLPSQLTQLENPHRPRQYSYDHSPPQPSTSPSSQVQEISVELADSIQLVIQTMLQISPPQVLDPAKEQFSACALSVPTSSMSAMFTAMKNINYISANMLSLLDVTSPPRTEKQQLEANRNSNETAQGPKIGSGDNEFDIGEMLQCVGDALSGAAAQAGVDLVIYHGDVGLKHVYVSGDESAISFALTHVVRQVLSTAMRGDSIELGLLLSPLSKPQSTPHASYEREPSPVDILLSAPHSTGPIQVSIRISHKYAPSESVQGIGYPKDVVTTEIRREPSFSTLLLRRILSKFGGNLVSGLPPPEAFTSGRTCDLEMVLQRVRVPLSIASNMGDNDQNSEPSLDQLATFGKTLKGKRVILYAHAKGSFAHHLTSYLTAWGMDVSHVSPDGQVDGWVDSSSEQQYAYNPLLATFREGAPVIQGKVNPKPARPDPPSFIFIDDDVDVLKERLQATRFEHQPYFSPLNARKRPSLASHHRPRSSPQVARLMALNNATDVRPPVVIMHFTSISNYKLLKDVMQSIMTSFAATSTPLPEVMIIPKPAGPRRFLTALHTAVTKPIVDPFFIPIATSPTSPLATTSGFFSPANEQIPSTPHQGTPNSSSSKHSSRPPGSRTNSDRSTRTSEPSVAGPAPAPSPVILPDNIEYFPASTPLGSSPSSGVVIQSPDGQTAGIYFHPKGKSASRKPSTQSMERDRGQLDVPPPRGGETSRRVSGGKQDEPIGFSTLHQVASAPSSSSIKGKEKEKAREPSEPSVPRPPLAPLALDSRTQSIDPLVISSVPSPVEQVRTPAQPAPRVSGTPSRRNGKRPSDSKDPASASGPKAKGRHTGSNDANNIIPPISVLIVDDNPINQTILSTFMRKKKIRYDLASNGQEAVHKWRTGGFHLILMDIQMPVMDGIQATKEIRRLEATNANAGFPPLTPSTEESKTPSDMSTTSSISGEARSLNSPYRSSVIIVALTASSLQVDRVNALEAGCNDFLTKPVSLLWLNNKIIEWGSIKALQMYADVRPDARRTIASGQAEQARNVAERLHVPPRGRNTPSPPQRTSSLKEENYAAIALASSSGTFFSHPQGPSRSTSVGNGPPSPTSTVFRTPPDQSSSPASSHYMTPPERTSSLDTSMLTNILETKSLVREPPESYDDNVTPTSRISRSRSAHIGVPPHDQPGKCASFPKETRPSDDTVGPGDKYTGHHPTRSANLYP
ncbi:hypothetical protein CVT24_005387 [Panaeolus cyanescens]|uniref:Response regulatory domain-containing protein n=1 Tax=Panaeolus cyanescens TaxID=181874 RepID=A0A409VR28_9AGAR|nr:hypothetical protein CVT24_005387 [Panaeolus cyanescens]